MGIPSKITGECWLQLVERGRFVKVCGQLRDVDSAGGVILVDRPINQGMKTQLYLAGYETKPLPVVIEKNLGGGGTAYQVAVKLNNASWPYELYSTLMNLTPKVNQIASSPECFRALGVIVPCEVGAVHAAFRERVRQAHPDRGGDLEAFVKLRQAYLEALEHLGGTR